MNNVSIVLYVVRLRSLKDNKYLNLNSDKGYSLISVINEYCNSRKSISCINSLKKAININDIKVFDESFYGKLETGNYGYSSSIKDIRSSQITHSKTNQEVDMIPLFFRGHIPKNSYKGLLAVEKFRGFGCKTVLEDDINEFFASKKYEYRITFHPMLPEKVAKQYLQNGEICKMRLVKHTVPQDVADVYKNEYKYGKFGTFEYVFNAKRNKKLEFFKDNINKFLNNAIGINNIIEVQGISYDNIKVEMEIGGKKRTISLNNLSNLTGNIDISYEVEFDIEGHPKYDSILEITTNIMDDYIKVIDYKNFELITSKQSKEGEINAKVAVVNQ